MVSQINPIYFSTITIFIILVTFRTSCGDYNEYEKCLSSVSCGNVTNIGYPFWGAGRPMYCGHPALQVECVSNHSYDYPTVKISLRELGIEQDFGDEEITYNILSIYKNPKQDNIIIKLKKLIVKGTCTINFNTTEFDESNLFEYKSYVQNISLIHGSGCPVKKTSLPSFTCGDNRTNITVYYVKNASKWIYDSLCTRINYPVLVGKELNDLRSGKGTLMDVFKQEFEVIYSKNYSSACFDCENSGGVCGSYNSSEFVCHCKDSPSQLSFCQKSKSGKMKLILAIVIPGGILIFIILNVALCYCKNPKLHSPHSHSRLILSDAVNSDLKINFSKYDIPVFSYNELQKATNNFDQTQELGDGGFGIVYYGKLRDGREVAVKRLYEKNHKRMGQFTNEIEILTKLRHKNLVTLYGCTSRHSQELLLVYEFIPNGTVADHLYGEKSVSKTLPWTIRMKIAIETASALSYLHASDIIHRDVKSNNILLDNNFTVKVADFGLSRLFPFDATHVSTAPQGTPGYLDPEYHKCYKVTSKSDVYSFGVVLIELISSLPAIDISRSKSEINLSDYAVKRIQNGDLDKLIDQNLGFESDFKVKRMTTQVAELAFQCLHQETEVRPSMEEVFEALKQIESEDYEAIEAEVTSWRKGETEPISEDDVDQLVSSVQNPPSPSSVFEKWVSCSTASKSSS